MPITRHHGLDPVHIGRSYHLSRPGPNDDSGWFAGTHFFVMASYNKYVRFACSISYHANMIDVLLVSRNHDTLLVLCEPTASKISMRFIAGPLFVFTVVFHLTLSPVLSICALANPKASGPVAASPCDCYKGSYHRGGLCRCLCSGHFHRSTCDCNITQPAQAPSRAEALLPVYEALFSSIPSNASVAAANTIWRPGLLGSQNYSHRASERSVQALLQVWLI